jgi:hypothetical protein
VSSRALTPLGGAEVAVDRFWPRAAGLDRDWDWALGENLSWEGQHHYSLGRYRVTLLVLRFRIIHFSRSPPPTTCNL